MHDRTNFFSFLISYDIHTALDIACAALTVQDFTPRGIMYTRINPCKLNGHAFSTLVCPSKHYCALFQVSNVFFTRVFVAVDGGWSSWQEAIACTATCGGGTRYLTRRCNNPTPANGGRDCEGETIKADICAECPCE